MRTSSRIQNHSQVPQRRKEGDVEPRLLKRGVKRSVYLLVNQALNPPFLFPSPGPHLAMCHQSAPSFPALSQPSFFFFFWGDNRIQLGLVWRVAGASHFHKSQQVISPNANVGIKNNVGTKYCMERKLFSSRDNEVIAD